MNVALFGGAAELLPARRAWNVALARSQCFENGVKMFHRFPGAANHHAVAALQAPDAAAGPNVDIVNATVFQLLRSPNIIFVIRVAAVNDDVTRLKTLGQGVDCLLR